MNRATLPEGDSVYTVALDDDPAIGTQAWSVVQGHLVDELTGMPVTSSTKVTPAGTAFLKPSARAAVTAQVGSGGVVGLVGVPLAALPQVRTQSYDVGITVWADGYIPVTVTKPLGPQSTFPTDFAPADVGDLALHRMPIVLRGRAVRRLPTGEMVALPSATVRVTAIWRTIPSASVVTPPLAPDLASLAPPLYANRAASSAKIHGVTVTQVSGEDKTTLAASAVGDTTLPLSDHVNLAAGDTIVIDDSDPGLREVVTVTAVTGPSSPTQPVMVTFAFPLAVAHARGVVVRKATISVTGTTDAIDTNAIAGDATVLLGSATTLSVAGFVSIDGGGATATEYHWLTPYSVSSDSDGYYRMPPLSRVAQLSIEADQAPYTAVPQTLSPNYAVREQIVDLVVT